MNPRLKTLAALLSVLPFGAACAVEQLAALDTVVVTATRQAQRVNELLSDVTVIEPEEIRAAGPTATINELLARQPGIEINQKGGAGTDSSVFIRGSNTTHTLVLIDGTRIGSTTTGYPAWGFIPLEQVERIEIIRGPCSSLYGSDAIGGVIQIFTKHGEGPFQAYAEAGYGSWNTSALSAGFSGARDGWRYSFQLADKQGDAYSAINNPKNSAYNPDKDGYQITSSSGSLSYSPAKGQEIGVNYLYSDGWNRYDASYPGTAKDDFKQKETIYGVNIYSRNQLTDNWTSTLRVGQSADDGRQLNNGIQNSSIRSEQTQYQWQNDIKLPMGSALIGIERVEQHVSSGDTDYTVKQRSIDSILAGWTGHFGNNRLQVNVREDNNSQFGDKTTGSLAYGYQFSSNWRGNLSWGNAFKAPSFNDLYWPGSGNPNLKPETSENQEASIHFETGAQHLSLTYYQNDIKNMIEWAPQPSGWWLPDNVAKARLTGWTLAYNGQFGSYKLSGSLDLQDPEDTVRHKVLRYRAREIAKVALSRDFADFNIGGEVLSSGKRYNDVSNTQELAAYTTLNLYAGYRVAADWSVFARANNVFNIHYVLVQDYATPGANFFVGLRYTPK